jgi:hypothetical protein
VEQEELKGYIRKNEAMIFYENIRNVDFAKYCCIYYDMSINFGSINEKNFSGLCIGNYIFNSGSSGTILFDFSLSPIGIATSGSFDFYPWSNNIKNEYNIIIPFSHIGVIFLLKKYVNPLSVELSEYLKDKCFMIEKYKKFIEERDDNLQNFTNEKLFVKKR